MAHTPTAQPAPAGARGYRHYVLAVLALVYAVNFVDRQIVSVLAVPIKAELGLTDTGLGLLGGLAFALLYTVLGVPAARLADRTGRVAIISLALALWSAMTALCALATGFGTLFLARVGVGVGEAGGVAPAYALIGDYYPPGERARALGIFSFGSPLGSAAGILAGGWVASHLGWRAAFVAVGLAGLALAPLLRLTVAEPARTLDRPPAAGLRQVLIALGKRPAFGWLALGAGLASMAGYALFFWMPSLLVRSFGLSLAEAARGFGLMLIVAGPAGLWLGGALADRFVHARRAAYAWVPMTAFLLCVPCYALGLTAPSATLCLVVLAVPSALGLMWLGPVMAAVQELVEPGMRATAAAVFLLIVNLLGLGVGTPLFGALSDLLHARSGADSLRWAILAGTACYPLAALCLARAAHHLDAGRQR